MMAVPGLVVGIQDMGAAGLTCSTCETASRGGAGIEIELDRVPQRETGMNSYEIMLSESQERMLVIVQQGREREIEEVFAKWDLHAARHRRGDRHGPDGRDPARRHGGRHSGAGPDRRGAPLPAGGAGAGVPGGDPRLDARGGGPARPRRGRRRCRAAAPARPPDDRLQALALPPVRPHGPARDRRRAGQRRRRRAAAPGGEARNSSRSATTATAATASSIPTAGRRSPWSSACATSSARARRRWR